MENKRQIKGAIGLVSGSKSITRVDKEKVATFQDWGNLYFSFIFL